MKYRLEGVTIEAIDTFVRVTVAGKTEVTARQCPKSIDVAIMLGRMQGYEPNRAQLQACGRAADDARLPGDDRAPRTGPGDRSRDDGKHTARRYNPVSVKPFPTILIIIDVLAAIAYIPSGDWRHVVYWLSAAVLTVTVTF